MLKEFTVSAYATSDGPKDATAQIFIPDNAVYVSHRIDVWTKNNNAHVKNSSVDRLPNGRAVRVWVDITAPGKTLFGPRNWIGVHLTVTVDVAATKPQKALKKAA